MEKIKMDENTAIWKITHLWWILISFIFLFNGFGLLYAGFKTDERLWKIEGTIYEVIVLLFIIAVSIQPNSSLSSFITGIYLLSWIISIIRSFVIRNQYLEKIRHDKYQNSRYSHKNGFNEDITKANTSNSISQAIYSGNENSQVYEKPINKKQIEDLNINQRESIKQVNINNAPLDVIAQLPGLDVNKAEKIIRFRESGKAINSLDELKNLLELDDNQIEQIKEYVIITQVNNKSQRKLDL